MGRSALGLRAVRPRLWPGVMSLAAMLTFGTGHVSAQQTAVCSDTPAEGERIECTEPSTSSADITVVA